MDEWFNKWIHNELFFSLGKEENDVIHNRMDKQEGYYVKSKKLDREMILHGITYIWNKGKKVEFRETENRVVAARKVREIGRGW